ncbi:MAG TPA: MDR family MFS transporter [Planctomycetota bacterium]|nr:MDR family MFS transporter [Planctomycetota bacterium]
MGAVEPHPKRKLATIGILVGLLLSALDGTVVATALPQILEDLNGFGLYFLPNALFMLCQTVSMPIWGRLSDLYGRSKFHLLAVIILVTGSVLCGMSHSMPALVGFRALQGLGAGGLMSLSFTMIADLYDLEERAKMQGAISSVWGVAALIGPLLGGWMTKAFGWPSIFFLNIPVGLVTAVIVQAAWKDTVREGKGRVDLPGGILLALASCALLVGFQFAGREGWTTPHSLESFGAALALVVALFLVERSTPDPFLAFDLYRNRLFSTGAATGVCAMVCLFAAIMHVPLLVTGVLRQSLEKGGLMLTCMMLPWMVCSALTKMLLKRFSYRTLAIGGMIFAVAAYGLLSQVGMDASVLPVILSMVILGTGLGLTVAPLLIAAQNAVTKDRLGTATSLTQFTRSMGSAVGLAIMGTLFLAPFGGKEPEGLIDFKTKFDPARLKALIAPLVVGLHHVFLATLLIAVLGIVLALSIPSGKAADLKLSAPVPEG